MAGFDIDETLQFEHGKTRMMPSVYSVTFTLYWIVDIVSCYYLVTKLRRYLPG